MKGGGWAMAPRPTASVLFDLKLRLSPPYILLTSLMALNVYVFEFN